MNCREHIKELWPWLKERSGQIEPCMLLCAILFVVTLPFHLHGALLAQRFFWADASRLVGLILFAVAAAGFIFFRTDAWEHVVSSRLFRVVSCLSGIASMCCSLMSVCAGHTRFVYMALALALAGVFLVHGAVYFTVRVRGCPVVGRLLVLVVGVVLFTIAKCLLAAFGDVTLLFLVPVLSLVVAVSYFDIRPFVGKLQLKTAPGEAVLPDITDSSVYPRVLAHDLSDLVRYAQVAWGLTPREREVLPGLAHGHSIGRIAQAQSVSVNTIRTHVKGIYSKAGVHSQQELMVLLENIEASMGR